MLAISSSTWGIRIEFKWLIEIIGFDLASYDVLFSSVYLAGVGLDRYNFHIRTFWANSSKTLSHLLPDIDILEEFAFLKSQDGGKINLDILPQSAKLLAQ